MLDKFKSLSTFSKAIVIAAAAVIVIAVGCVVGVLATGGFNGF